MERMQRYNTIYDAIGGADAIRRIVESFYPKSRLTRCLAFVSRRYFSGYGKAIHVFVAVLRRAFAIFRCLRSSDDAGTAFAVPGDASRAEAWLGCMREALTEIGLEPELRDMVITRLSGPAHHFVNTQDEEG